MWFVNFTLDTCFAIHLLTTYLVNPPPPFSSIRSEISGTRLKSRCLRGRKRSTGEFELEFPTGSQARRKFNGRASSVDEDRKFNTFVFLISLACFSAGKIGVGTSCGKGGFSRKGEEDPGEEFSYKYRADAEKRPDTGYR